MKENVMKGVYKYGFKNPSKIQKTSFPGIISGRDVIIQSQSGTGKSALLSFSLLNLINYSLIGVSQALILTPTRELARQLSDLINDIHLAAAGNSFVDGVCLCCVGGNGSSFDYDAKKLESGIPIVSGTPGRVFDMISKGHFNTKGVKYLFFDEADELIGKEMFREQVYDIFKHLPGDVQVVCSSATMSNSVVQMAEKFMKYPLKILVPRTEVSLEGIKQYYILVEKPSHKYDTLCSIYDSLTISQAVIFCNSRESVDILADQMKKENFSVVCMHAGMVQKERDSVMNDFILGKSRVLIATDVWARGLDVKNVTTVINYDFPLSRECYLHRIGRSGRFGRKGIAISIVTKEEMPAMHTLEKYYSISIEEMQTPKED